MTSVFIHAASVAWRHTRVLSYSFTRQNTFHHQQSMYVCVLCKRSWFSELKKERQGDAKAYHLGIFFCFSTQLQDHLPEIQSIIKMIPSQMTNLSASVGLNVKLPVPLESWFAFNFRSKLTQLLRQCFLPFTFPPSHCSEIICLQARSLNGVYSEFKTERVDGSLLPIPLCSHSLLPELH